MKAKSFFVIAAFAAITSSVVHAQQPKEKGLEAITKEAVKGQLEFLASDWMEGRQTGERGAYMAADYIASMFKVYGLQPGGDFETTGITRAEYMAGKRPVRYRSYYQKFPLIEYKAGEIQELALLRSTKSEKMALHFEYETDFFVNTSDVGIEVEAPVVFAGYGFTDKEAGYDDFKGVDVEGKILLCLGGYPGMDDTTSAGYRKFGEMSRWQLYRAKREHISETGAVAMIEYYPGRDMTLSWADNVPFRYNSDDYEGDKPRASAYGTSMKHPGEDVSSGVTRISVSERVVNEILKGTEIDLEAFANRVKNTLKPESQELKTARLKLKTTVDSRIIQARNVVGVLPGKDTSEIIVIGGHYDHIGKHDGWIWNGADDNASGTVGVMTIAKAMMAAGEQPEKTIVFAAWTGEEKGLLGSEYFADHPWDDAEMILNLNYDMISRDDMDDTLGVKCGMTYTKKYGVLEELSENHNQEYGLGLEVEYSAQERPRGGSDHTPFAAKDVPVFYYMAGFPPEYHSTNDHVEKVNWDKMVKIIQLGYLNIWELSNSDWQ